MFSSASTISSRPEGMGRGIHADCSGLVASGLRSMTTASRSVPATPSTSAWCVLDSMAQRPSSSPSTTQISHSGFDRSSCCAMTRPTSLRSSLSPPGRRERRVAQVVLDVEVRVVHPDRPPELQRDELDLLAVARDQVQLGVHHRHDVPEGRRRALEDGDGRDVHVGHVVLDVEERRVQGAQTVRAHRPPFGGASGPHATTGRRRTPGVSRRWRRRSGEPSEARRGVARIRRRVSS